MTLKREDIKKLIIQQMLLESIQEEGVIQKWLSNTALKGGDKLTKLGQRMAPKPEEDPEFLQDLSKIADFIQMYRDSKTITDSDFYKKFVMGVQEQINEQYQSQFLKQILSKKPTVKDVQDFVNHIGSNQQLSRELRNLQLKKVEVPSSPISQKPATAAVTPPDGKKAATTETPPETAAADKTTSAAVTTTTSAGQTGPETPIDVKVNDNIVNTNDVQIQVKPKPQSGGGRRGKAAAKNKANEEARSVADLIKLQKQGRLSGQDKTKLINILSGMSAEERANLQEAIVEEIFNLLTGKTK